MLRSLVELPARAGWGQRYRELVAYRDAHGHCCVPKAQGTLGRWVARQRELRKKKALSPDREAKLAALGFVWNTNDSAWDARFAQLQAWKAAQGHASVPIAEGDLGVWVAKQRQLKRKKKLAAGREARLNAVNFVWDTPNTDWNEKYQALARWKTVCGDCRVPFNEGELGWWVNTQRQSKRKGKLSKEREDRLNEIGFIWNPQGVPPSSAAARAQTAEAAGTLPATGSGSGSNVGVKRRSEDRSSGGGSSKRHHSFSTDSASNSFSNSFSFTPTPRGFYSANRSGNTSSASSVDEFYAGRDSSDQFAWGGTSPARSAASADQTLPPLVMPSMYGGAGAPQPALPSMAVPGQAFTATTATASAGPATFERLPSVRTLAAPPPTRGWPPAGSPHPPPGQFAQPHIPHLAFPPHDRPLQSPGPMSAHGSVAGSPRGPRPSAGYAGEQRGSFAVESNVRHHPHPSHGHTAHAPPPQAGFKREVAGFPPSSVLVQPFPHSPAPPPLQQAKREPRLHASSSKGALSSLLSPQGPADEPPFFGRHAPPPQTSTGAYARAPGVAVGDPPVAVLAEPFGRGQRWGPGGPQGR